MTERCPKCHSVVWAGLTHDCSVVVLQPKAFDRIVALVENSPAPSDRLIELMRKDRP